MHHYQGQLSATAACLFPTCVVFLFRMLERPSASALRREPELQQQRSSLQQWQHMCLQLWTRVDRSGSPGYQLQWGDLVTHHRVMCGGT